MSSKQPPAIDKEKPHIAGLNGLKALAIIGVTLFHMFPETIKGGFLGVSLFFVVSGYLLAFTTLRQWKRGTFTILSYAKKRIQRIYPPLLIMMLTTIDIYSYVLPKTMVAIRPEVLSIILGYNNWWQIVQNADYFTRIVNASPFTPLWFLAVELQYFVIWPVLLVLYIVLANKWRPAAGIMGMAILAVVTAMIMPLRYVLGQDVTPLYNGTDTRVYALLFGSVLGLLRVNRHIDKMHGQGAKQFLIAIFMVCCVTTLVGYIKLDGQYPAVYQGIMLGFTVLFCMMVLLCESRTLPIGKYMDMPILDWLGRKSYAIFLWQYPVLFLAHRMHWENAFTMPILYYGMLLAIILLLTIWTDDLTHVLLHREARRAFLDTCKRSYTVGLTVVALAFMLIGCQSIVLSSDSKMNDLDQLQNRLAVNASEQNTANQKALEKRDVMKDELSGIACIGDSVMLGSAGELRKVLPNAYIDAKVSRYVGAGLDIAKQLDAQQHLGNIVLVGLGTNGPITGYYENETKALIEYLGPDREIFWVNVYGPDLDWQDSNNAYLEKIAKIHKNVTIIDWYGLIKDHKDWLADDGVHPNDKGVEEYAKLVETSIKERLAQKKVNDSNKED